MSNTSNMQSAMVSNRFIIGIVAFGVSFGLSLVLSWDFNKSFFTGIITVPATYLAVLFVDKRRRNHEMLVLDSLHKRIKEMEGMKSRFFGEINELEAHRNLLYTESNQLQKQVSERCKQRDSLNRELGNFALEKKQIEVQVGYLQGELINLDKAKVDLNNVLSNLNSEKRRMELNSNVTRSEINQLHTQLGELLLSKQGFESELTLLERIRPQLEEKLYNLRIKIQELEVQETKAREFLLTIKSERKNIESSLKSLRTDITEQQIEFQQLQSQVSLLQQERDQLQSQVWELLQQMETINQETFPGEGQVNDFDFLLDDLLETLEPIDSERLPQEWSNFIQNLPEYEIQVLKAIIEPDNPNSVIKNIALSNITMPNLLIDSINERANDIIGELIIDTGTEKLEIYPEHLSNVKKAIAIYDLMARQISSK
ncbi:MAG: hypothetical protein KME60_04800 [Cyanomargarita calcarea GSE-NOS-MK-12-04C]|uniref:TerB-C domain-containing protein n=1 Tax=Cyanomargarita calcarea GSE-NOS-MK-12-04C TaxID=2839659 RepID=A0A951US09_9CYAN|nr:hypothetical protein [Cyanomargarita calcarea GSE-NOS-MK-12-04C]